ncbi:MAG TPA: DUF3179 domain-containing (seleno)protein [Tepidisphaeraceae bacterium]|nr:DUF3179 domain-containing (seleno)protein [Tepidisphaeraceae bacterium]
MKSLIPILILTTAAAAAAVAAVGSQPNWAVYSHGLDLIMLSRRVQWPLIAVAVMASALVAALVAAGRWRVYWLIGLTPVVALFAHRFTGGPARSMCVDANASFLSPDQTDVAGDEYIVGLIADGQSYAYPYRYLFHSPVVVQAMPQRRVVLIWSADANRAVATTADWSLSPRDLEIVSTPADSLLLYNNEIGQFIVGVTGLTPSGARPSGFDQMIPTVKTTWKNWLTAHPRTLVLHPLQGCTTGPTSPIVPRFALPRSIAAASVQQVALIQSPHPAFIADGDVTAAPLNLMVGVDPMLIFRDNGGTVRAFMRVANGDLTPRFIPVSTPRNTRVIFTEHDSNSQWTDDGRAIGGQLKGEKLQPFDVDDGVYLSVLRYWYPQIQSIVPTPADVGVSDAAIVAGKKSAARHRRHSHHHASLFTAAS